MSWWWLPFIAAVVGWLTASISIWLFFRLLPKRQKTLVANLSRMMGAQFPIGEIQEKIASYDNFQKILPAIESHIDDFLQHKLTRSMPYLGMFIGEKTIKQLKELFMEELAELFPVVMKNYVGQLQQEIKLEDVLHAKLAAISSDRIEVAMKELLANEWRMVKMMGVVMGFVIGLIQLAMAWAMGLIG